MSRSRNRNKPVVVAKADEELKDEFHSGMLHSVFTRAHAKFIKGKITLAQQVVQECADELIDLKEKFHLTDRQFMSHVAGIEIGRMFNADLL